MTDSQTQDLRDELADRDQTNGWTGGQYSLYRVLLAVGGLGVLLASSTGWRGSVSVVDWLRLPPAMHDALPWSFGLLLVLVAIGWFDRIAAAVAVVLALGLGSEPLSHLLILLLIAHALTAARPYGSIGALGRSDPGGGWKRANWNLGIVAFGPIRFGVIVVSLLTGGALTRDVSFLIALITAVMVPFCAALRKACAAFWLFALMCLVSIYLGDYEDSLSSILELPLLLLLAVAMFDPSWIPARRGKQPEVIYYDGECGLCHRTVRFLLAEDRTGDGFRFATLQSDHFAQGVSENERRDLGDSVIVRTADGRLLQRSDAVVRILLVLGGFWRVIGSAFWCVPRPLRDAAYDLLARLRKRLFAQPKNLCPMMPPELGVRFLP